MDNLIKAFKVIKGFDEVFGEVISCIGGGKFITRARPLKKKFGMYFKQWIVVIRNPFFHKAAEPGANGIFEHFSKSKKKTLHILEL